MLPESEIRKLVADVVHRVVGPGTPVAGQPPPASAPLPSRRVSAQLIYQDDVRGIADGGELRIGPGNRLTPLAQEFVLQRRIKVVVEKPAAPSAPTQGGLVAIGSDHGGFAMKEALKKFLIESGYKLTDVGTNGTEAVDYPDFAYAVAKMVADGQAWRGIMVDGAGIGSCMVANKVPGVRASMCYDVSTASNAREHNDANVLTLGGALIGANLAQQIVKTWLATPFGGGRHAKRVNKIVDVEQRFARK
ncbi:MAG: ribose 5-phosphate isomerase B [Chloroflexi bacterium]|nr:ribose 5-phosphate isomerase B [Chloroflexota bacterium]